MGRGILYKEASKCVFNVGGRGKNEKAHKCKKPLQSSSEQFIGGDISASKCTPLLAVIPAGIGAAATGALLAYEMTKQQNHDFQQNRDMMAEAMFDYHDDDFYED